MELWSEVVVNYKSEDKKIEKLVEEMKRSCPEVLRKCLKVWESKKSVGKPVSVEDMLR